MGSGERRGAAPNFLILDIKLILWWSTGVCVCVFSGFTSVGSGVSTLCVPISVPWPV